MALMTFEQAKQYLDDPHACFKLSTSTRHLTLLPKYIGNVKAGIHDYLDSELNLNSRSLDGIPIAYSNVRRLQRAGRVLDESPSIYLDIQAEFIVFQPTVDSVLKGVVNKISGGHVGCLVHGRFNASIPRSGGSGESWPGFQLQIGEEFLFRVARTTSQNGVLSMEGSFHQSLGVTTSNTEAAKKGKKRKLDDIQDLEDHDFEIPVMSVRKKHKKHSRGSAALPDFLPMTSTPQRSFPSVGIDSGAPSSEHDANSTLDITDAASLHKKHKKKKHKRDREMDLSISVATEPEQDSTIDVIELELLHKKHKKKKHKKDRESSASLDILTPPRPGSLDLSAFSRDGSDSPEAPSDVTHDSGIMSVDSDTVFKKPHKKSKKKSKVKEPL